MNYPTSIVGGASGVLVGQPSSRELLVLSTGGDLARIIRWSSPAHWIGAAGYDSIITRTIEPAPEEARSQLRDRLSFGAPQDSTRLPDFTLTRFGSDGSIWVRLYARGEPMFHSNVTSFGTPCPGRDRYLVLDRDGRPVARIEAPPAVEIHDVGPGYLLGVWRGALDVEHVRLHRIVH